MHHSVPGPGVGVDPAHFDLQILSCAAPIGDGRVMALSEHADACALGVPHPVSLGHLVNGHHVVPPGILRVDAGGTIEPYEEIRLVSRFELDDYGVVG